MVPLNDPEESIIKSRAWAILQNWSPFLKKSMDGKKQRKQNWKDLRDIAT